MKTLLKFNILIATLAFAIVGAVASDQDKFVSDETIMSLVPELKISCESEFNNFKSKQDSTELAFLQECRIRDKSTIQFNDMSYDAVAVGCVGHGQFLVFKNSDSTDYVISEIYRMPTHYIATGGMNDINNDGIPELVIYIGSGSHGMYVMLLSVYEDKMVSITDENGLYQFMASGGGIKFDDLDDDGTLELILSKMIWPSDTNKIPHQMIYKWDGKHYTLQEN